MHQNYQRRDQQIATIEANRITKLLAALAKHIFMIMVIMSLIAQTNAQGVCSTTQIRSSLECSIICDVQFSINSLSREASVCGTSILNSCDTLCCNSRFNFNYTRTVNAVNIQFEYKSAIQNFCTRVEQNIYVTNIGLIIAIVVISICLILIIGQVIYAIWKYCKGQNQGQQESGQARSQSAQIMKLDELSENNNPGVVKSRTYLLNPKEQCSICLEQKTNFMTKCGHFFHAECLGRWLDRNIKCPLCQSSNFNPVIVYCDSCNYRACALKISKKRGRNGQEMKKFNKYYCQSCKRDIISQANQDGNKPQRNIGQ